MTWMNKELQQKPWVNILLIMVYINGDYMVINGYYMVIIWLMMVNDG